jgi:hypothetical protein
MTTTRTRRAALSLALAGLVAGTAATGAAAPSTMPAANPSDAAAAELVTFQKAVPAAKLGGKASSYFYATNGGGQVKIGKTTTRGFTAFQTVTVTPPSGTTILQGFATISGGNTGSRLITSTSTAPAAYTIKLSEPGAQGTPGKLTFRIQVVPKPG